MWLIHLSNRLVFRKSGGRDLKSRANAEERRHGSISSSTYYL